MPPRVPVRVPRRRVAAKRSAPATQSASAPPAVPDQTQASNGGMLSELGRTVAEGFAFGVGSSIAHNAVNSIASMFGGGGNDNDDDDEPLL
ncbi:Aste57867_2733 [Aphanomyces stellatus]|uniref:Aste57867_2733 protein n=1 Tax=Aphanomyces stellatus TaxID=120398 RepID=A0A485KDE0_9STRA|nr:hypothetical protein As57867_002726 [Aphanomyces stellatus]VFT79925.1 Aste57867_2733 [Aphanomyces stellatus]